MGTTRHEKAPEVIRYSGISDLSYRTSLRADSILDHLGRAPCNRIMDYSLDIRWVTAPVEGMIPDFCVLIFQVTAGNGVRNKSRLPGGNQSHYLHRLAGTRNLSGQKDWE